MPAPRRQASDSIKTVCKGGPSIKHCGAEVKDGQEGVECEKCMYWYHFKCHGIPKAAQNAMKIWHGTLVWLCESCSASLKQPAPAPAPCKCTELMPSVAKLETLAHHNVNKLDESMANQEKMFLHQSKILDKVTALTDSTSKKSYAEALKEAGKEVVDRVGKEFMEQVTKKMEKISAVNIPVQRSHEEVAGILDEIQDKEKRKLNVVIHNLHETDGDTHTERTKGDEAKFTEMVKEGLKLVVKPVRSFRVGKRCDTKPRLMIVTLANNADKVELLRSAASLRDTPRWNRVFITPDLTWQEREKGRQLREELARRKESGEQHIWIRRGRIVPIPKEKQLPEADRQRTLNNSSLAQPIRPRTQVPPTANPPQPSERGNSQPTSQGRVQRETPSTTRQTPAVQTRMNSDGSTTMDGEAPDRNTEQVAREDGQEATGPVPQQ